MALSVQPSAALLRPHVAATSPIRFVASPPKPPLPQARKPVTVQVPPKANVFHRLATWVLRPYLNYAAGLGETRFMHPTRQADTKTPMQVGLPGQALAFKSADGTPLTGWYIPASAPTNKTVVLAHGHGGNMGEMIEEFAPFLHAAGYNVVAFDFRNSGSSGGQHTTLGYEERTDLRAAVDQAAALGGKSLAVLGVSMGASTAIEEAADDTRVKTLVADCAFDTLSNAILPRVKASTTNVGPLKGVHYPFPTLASEAILNRVVTVSGEPLTDVDPIKEVSRLGDRAMLFIHGAADDETPPDCSARLFAADPGRDKAIVYVPGAKHAESHTVDKAGYEQRVLALLGRTL